MSEDWQADAHRSESHEPAGPSASNQPPRASEPPPPTSEPLDPASIPPPPGLSPSPPASPPPPTYDQAHHDEFWRRAKRLALAKFILLYLPAIGLTLLLLVFVGGFMCSKGCTAEESTNRDTLAVVALIAVTTMVVGIVWLLLSVSNRTPKSATIAGLVVLACDLVLIVYVFYWALVAGGGAWSWLAAAVMMLSVLGQVWLVLGARKRWVR